LDAFLTFIGPVAQFGGAALQKQTNLHWQSFLTIKEYSALNGYDALWTKIYKPTVRALYSDDIAKAAGITTKGAGDFSAMQKKIAYSVVDPGQASNQKPYGDTAIGALFDDIKELGTVFSFTPESGRTPASFFSKTVTGSLFGSVDVKQEIANLIVQYAGALAQKKIIEGNGKVSTSSNGVTVTVHLTRRFMRDGGLERTRPTHS
jgi:hypothetical protein